MGETPYVIEKKAMELDNIAERLGDRSDPFAAWESLEALIRGYRRLVQEARTTGGVQGPDYALMAACDDAEAMLACLGPEPI